jgi:ABC transport system ATP-binding/permease protein
MPLGGCGWRGPVRSWRRPFGGGIGIAKEGWMTHWLGGGTVLELKDATLFIGGGGDVKPLLSDITATFPRGHFGAVIGPSGCGKSTLLKLIAGIAVGEEEGELYWEGRDLMGGADFEPSEIGYVPQFSIAHEELTAFECVEYALRLRVAGLGGEELRGEAERVLGEVGMVEFGDRRVRVLSGGQRRRLALAMEVVSKPVVLLADEVTSGLDPQAEDEIVRLMHGLSRTGGRVVLSVTHSLRHLELYDSVAVLFGGVLAYHGPPESLSHYFRCEDPQDLFGRLETREPHEWGLSWKKHRAAFAEAMRGRGDTRLEKVHFESEGGIGEADGEADAETAVPVEEVPVREVSAVPGVAAQFLTLLTRRLRIFSRDTPQLLLQAGLVFGFPLLVAVFALNGLPAVQNLSMGLNLDVVQQLHENMQFLVQGSKIGSLVSGIIMFQVILLTLMGANNSGREIASERLIFEKEKLAGLHPVAYVTSKAAFLSLLVLAQSVWMGVFVHYVCGFPGPLGPQLVFLIAVNAAMTSVCLAISSLMQSPGQASLVSIYLVGFQLPLSGAVLALPDWAATVTRPFIAAYWSWSGILQTLRGERYYDIVQTVVQTALSPAALCLWVLLTHIAVGLIVALVGCQKTLFR